MPLPFQSFRYRHLGNYYLFQVSAPYGEGHVMTKAEAQAMNVLRAENIQNNLRQAFADEAGRAEGDLLSQEQIQRVKLIVEKYDENYQFVEAHEPRVKLGALEKMARDIAIGRSQDGATEEEIENLANSIDVVSEARERLEAQAKIAQTSLSDLLA